MRRVGIVTRRWSPEDDALLKRLLEEGKARPVIAARLKRTIAAVETRAGFLRAQAAFRGPDESKREG